MQLERNHNVSHSKVDIIDCEHWYSCNGRHKHFMPPLDIEEIISKPKYCHELQRQDSRQILGKLTVRKSVQQSSSLLLSNFVHHLSISTSACRSDDILVKWKGCEDNDC
jgi:hypothetical protein